MNWIPPEFSIELDYGRCNNCKECIRQCTFGVYKYERNKVVPNEEKCVGCQRCVAFCPGRAIRVRPYGPGYRPNSYWTAEAIADIKRQAETGRALMVGMGNDLNFPVYWDRLLLNAAQVTNPAIDPLREPIELRTFLGGRPDALRLSDGALQTALTPYVKLETPILFAALSYGAINLRAMSAIAEAARKVGTLFNTGEGGFPRPLRKYGDHAIVQCASGRFGVDAEYLNSGVVVEIKIGQGAKPGMGGHLPGEKVSNEIAETRMIPAGTDALSPAPHHDIYSIEDLSTLIQTIKEATNYEKPVGVKIAAVHNSASIASGIVRAGADIIVLDGFRGGTGAAPKAIRNEVGIPIELALASVDRRLREEGIRNRVSIVVGGGIRCSSDVVKAIALGADAVYIGTAALIAMGCTMCQMCYTGLCSWGIATTNPALARRLDPSEAAVRLANLLRAWSLEIKEMLGAMGIDSIEGLRGNRDQLRGVGLHEWELEVLGVKGAGT